jgi:hypothetical protein
MKKQIVKVLVSVEDDSWTSIILKTRNISDGSFGNLNVIRPYAGGATYGRYFYALDPTNDTEALELNQTITEAKVQMLAEIQRDAEALSSLHDSLML